MSRAPLARTADRARRRPRALAPWFVVALTGALACQRDAKPDPRFLPDDVLRRELGLTDADRVHTIRIAGGDVEVPDPIVDSIPIGAYVQFVSADWFIHEVAFEGDSLAAEGRAFLERTDQMASPPIIHRDGRYVVWFAGAPSGRYPYLLQGNGRPGRGAIVVIGAGPG